MPVTVVTIRPRLDLVARLAVPVMAHLAGILTLMIFSVLVPNLAFVVPISSVRVSGHGGHEIEKVVVVQEINAFRFIGPLYMILSNCSLDTTHN